MYYRDGWHTTEDIGYLVVEAGTHYLSDGTQIVASTVDLTNETFRTVTFESAFAATPLVLGQVMTDNDTAAIAERIRNVTSDTLQIQLNEEEVSDGVHATETIGLIAIDRGVASADDISLNAVVTGNSVTHRNSTVNFGSIGGAASPVILSDMQTRDGGDAATIRHRSSTSTSVTLFVEEEASRDTELNHTTEAVGVLAIESGVLLGSTPPATAAESAPVSLDGGPTQRRFPQIGSLSRSLFAGSESQNESSWQDTVWVMQNSDQSGNRLFPEWNSNAERKAAESVRMLQQKAASFLNSLTDGTDGDAAGNDLDSWFAALAVEGIPDRV